LPSQGNLAIFPSTVEIKSPAERLVEGLGGRAEAAARFEVSREAIRLWLKDGIPAKHAMAVEEATAGWERPISAKDVLEFARQTKAAA
jgi:hypothetical protein